MFKNLYEWFMKQIKPEIDEVIIWVDEGSMNSIMKVKCDEFGYPKFRQIATMSMQMKNIQTYASINDVPKMVQVLKKEIHLDSPLVVERGFKYGKILVWKARLWGEDWENIDTLDIKTMQKIVTEAIEKQECIVLENVSDLVSSIKDFNK